MSASIGWRESGGSWERTIGADIQVGRLATTLRQNAESRARRSLRSRTGLEIAFGPDRGPCIAAARWLGSRPGWRRTIEYRTRAGRNFALDRQVEPLVLESEISGLADLHAFMKYQNYVTRFSFLYFDMPVVANGFEPRERPDDKLPYQPKRTSNG